MIAVFSLGTSDLAAEKSTGAQPEEVKLSAAQAELIGLETAYAKKATLAREIWLNGEVTANQDRTLQVLPKAGGVVTEVKKVLGDEVRANDVLAFIESQEISSSSAAYLVAKSKAELAQRQLERHETLWKKSVIAEEEYLVSQQAAAEARAQLRAAAQKLSLLGIDAETVDSSAPPSVSTHVPVLAPMSGTIIEKKIAVGDQVTDQTPLLRLADLEKVWVIANVFEQDMGELAVGLTATVVLRAYPERKFQGRVNWVSQVVDERTRTLAVRVELDNREKLLRPGSFARVLIKVPMPEASVSVPPSAVQRHNQEQIVFVDAGGGVYKLRTVKTNLKTPNEVEIVSGLAAGEKVVTNGSFMLKSELEKSSFGGE